MFSVESKFAMFFAVIMVVGIGLCCCCCLLTILVLDASNLGFSSNGPQFHNEEAMRMDEFSRRTTVSRENASFEMNQENTTHET